MWDIDAAFAYQESIRLFNCVCVQSEAVGRGTIKT